MVLVFQGTVRRRPCEEDQAVLHLSLSVASPKGTFMQIYLKKMSKQYGKTKTPKRYLRLKGSLRYQMRDIAFGKLFWWNNYRKRLIGLWELKPFWETISPRALFIDANLKQKRCVGQDVLSSETPLSSFSWCRILASEAGESATTVARLMALDSTWLGPLNFSELAVSKRTPCTGAAWCGSWPSRAARTTRGPGNECARKWTHNGLSAQGFPCRGPTQSQAPGGHTAVAVTFPSLLAPSRFPFSFWRRRWYT